MRKFRYIFSNKYLITGIAFVVWMLFFDRNNVPLQLKRIQELSKLQESERIMTVQIGNTREELQLLKTKPATLEKYAREKYLMKKDNEDLFIVTFDSSSLK